MDLTKNESRTLQYYDEHAVEWTSKRKGNFWKIEMEKFHTFLPSGKILEIGSGGGRDAAHLVRYGYDYTGTDISEGLLDVARKENPEGLFLHKSVYDLDFPKSFFDGFWCAATLLHIPKSRIPDALGNIRKVIKPDGIGFISLKEGFNEGIDGQTGRFFSYFQLNEFQKILDDSHYKIIDASKMAPDKSGTVWLRYFVG